MISEIEQQQKSTPVPAARRDWCCGSPITGPHVPGCAFEPTGPIDYAAPVQNTEPPAADTLVESAPAASVVPDDRPYGFSKAAQFDFVTPNGDKVLMRKLRRTQVVKMKLHRAFDSFSSELMSIINDDVDTSTDGTEQKTIEALTDTDVFDRVIVAAVICPELAIGDPALEDIEIEDKIAIFYAAMPDELQQAALEAQQDALKSVRGGPVDGVRDLRDGETVQPEAQ
jgi:hypothetical protein